MGYLKALQQDPTYAKAWSNLATTIKHGEIVDVLGHGRVDHRSVCLKALQHDPEIAYAWNNLAFTIRVDGNLL